MTGQTTPQLHIGIRGTFPSASISSLGVGKREVEKEESTALYWDVLHHHSKGSRSLVGRVGIVSGIFRYVQAIKERF